MLPLPFTVNAGAWADALCLSSPDDVLRPIISTQRFVRQDGQLVGPAQAARSLLGSALLLAVMEAAWAVHRKAYSYSPQLLAQVFLSFLLPDLSWVYTRGTQA